MPSWETKAADEFDQWAKSGRADGMESGHNHGAQHILSKWSFSKGSNVLDVGCGYGWLLRRMLKLGAESGTGVDISSDMIKRAKKDQLKGEHYCVASADQLPFDGAHFTHITNIESLYYYEHPEKALSEWLRVAKPSAKLGIMVDLFYENKGSHPWIDALEIPAHLLSISEYVEMLSKTGWKNISFKKVIDPSPIKNSKIFVSSSYFPNYSLYREFRETGSLILTAEA